MIEPLLIGLALFGVMLALAWALLTLANRSRRQQYSNCQHENTHFDKWERVNRCRDCGAKLQK